MPTPPPELHWESLPVELSLIILKHITDLTTLHNYINASPAAACAFDRYAVEIVESVLASGTIHEYTCAIIRIVAYLRSGAFPPGVLPNLVSFRDMYRHETTEHRYDPPRWTLLPLRLTPQTVSASVMRGVVASHHRNECLMIGCLNLYLGRFRELQPMHLVNPNFVWESQYHGPDDNEYIGAWDMQPAQRAFEKRDIGPPNWCEEQRVLRALWRVQVFEDLKAATDEGPLSTDWPCSDSQLLPRLKAEGLLDVDCDGLVQSDNEFYWVENQTIDLEAELVESVLEYIKENSTAISTSDFLQRTMRDWPVPFPPQPADDKELESYLSSTSLFFDVVHGNELSHVVTSWCTPLQHVPFAFYRRRGFAIWCDQRMSAYGFLGSSVSSRLMAWKSVLDKEELAEVVRINQRFYDELARSGFVKKMVW
jgi:hypothetical protein